MFKKLCSFILLLFITCIHVSAQDYRPVWNFDSLAVSIEYNSFQRPPSLASVYLNDSIYCGYGGRSMQINATKAEEGYCGAWINFFTQKNGKPQFINAGGFKYLSLRIRGESGNEQVQIQLSDKQLYLKEDSRPCKPLQAYLPKGITTHWQELLIPLADFNETDQSQLSGITINFITPGRHCVYIDDLYFKRDAETILPLSNIQHPKSGNKPLENALWVWQTYKLFNDLQYRSTFLTTCQRLQIKHVYLQLFYDDNLTTIQYSDSLRSLVKACRKLNMSVYGLDGSPEWGCYEKHEIPLSIAKLINIYNQSSAFEEKMAGVHFDIEPYLLLGFNIPAMRQQIIFENLELKRKLSEYCHTNHLLLGIDIPFWYEDPDSNGIPVTNIEFNGKTQAASFHMIDMADQVAIMGYRNFAFGSDGMINKDKAELEYANTKKGKDIWAGVETIIETPMSFTIFSGIPKEKLDSFLADHKSSVGRKSRFMGYRLLMFEEGNYVHFGLEKTTDKKRQARNQNQKASRAFKELLLSAADSLYNRENYYSLQSYLAKHKEFKVKQKGSAKDRISSWTVVSNPTDSKISFAQKPLEEMLLELYKASVVLYDYPSFRGFAFHCYETILEMK